MIQQFSTKTKELRQEHNPKITQEELAEYADVAVSTIQRIENPNEYYKVPLYIAQKIAAAFGLSVSDMLVEKETKAQQQTIEQFAQKIDMIYDKVLWLVEKEKMK